ncbi:MAG: hypothetical protein JWQ51_3412 [Tardiphaga sp.]|nr:hypothetical protein [Tardiphaga sp.]
MIATLYFEREGELLGGSSDGAAELMPVLVSGMPNISVSISSWLRCNPRSLSLIYKTKV